MKNLFGEMPARLVGFAMVLLAVVLLVLTVRILLVPFVAAMFLAYLFEPGILALQRRGMDRGKAYLLLIGLSLLGIAAVVLFAPSWLQLESTGGSGDFRERLHSQIVAFERWVDARVPMVRPIDIAAQVDTRVSEFTDHILSELPMLISSFTVNLLLVPFIAYFMVRDGRTLRRRIVSLVPNRYFEMALIMFHRVDGQIGGYLRGRLIECALTGVIQLGLMAVALQFVQQPQILLISAAVGVTNLIPYLGPVLSGGFGVFLYMGAGLPMSSVWALLGTVALCHLIDNIVIAPAVLSHNVDLHPLTVVLVLIIGGETLGVLGLLIAVPVAASIKVIVQEFYANYQVQVR